MFKFMIRLTCVMTAIAATLSVSSAFSADGTFKLGVIGATTSHVPAFIKTINDPNAQEIFQGFEIVGVFPGGVPDNADSWDRVQGYTRECEAAGLTVYKTIEELVQNVDGILLESVDGRVHLEQAKPVIAAKKPLYIDKPLGGSLRAAPTRRAPRLSILAIRPFIGTESTGSSPSLRCWVPTA